VSTTSTARTLEAATGSAAGSRRAAWRGPLVVCVGIWAVTRVLTVGIGSGIALAMGKSVTFPWRIWDGEWFIYIARHGYGFGPAHFDPSPAFYPLYPGLLWLSTQLLGGNTVVAGVLLAFPLTLAAFLLLFVLARDLVGERSALLAVAYIAVFPYAFFLQALYSETIFLVCAVAAFLAAERRRFVLAGVLAGAAMLARVAGVAVLAGLLVLALKSPARRANTLRLAAALPVFSIYPLVLALQGRSPKAFLTSEHGWRKYSAHDPAGTLLAPFRSLYDGTHAAWTGAVDIGDKLATGSPLSALAIHDVAAFATLALFVPLSVLAWKRLGSAYGVYCAVSFAIPLVARPAAAPLLSLPRFALALFPCFIVLGTLRPHSNVHRILLGASFLFLVGALYLWDHGWFFVA
jgi:hypothetical protein